LGLAQRHIRPSTTSLHSPHQPHSFLPHNSFQQRVFMHFTISIK
jgi:hypothetical protein